ncbi:MAG: hypothetical protein RLO51_00680 [Thalassobaculum sp.]|uniref:hypothetical protein n=1 Tax=Thalassobaculum sp. TaxID=2022740 RepID=UPI0032EDD2C9
MTISNHQYYGLRARPAPDRIKKCRGYAGLREATSPNKPSSDFKNEISVQMKYQMKSSFLAAEELLAMRDFANATVQHTFSSLRIGESTQIESWETPAQLSMVGEALVSNPANILELGYGAGIASEDILRRNSYDSYVCIEVHPLIAAIASNALSRDSSAVIINGAWQLVVPALRHQYFDAIINDAYLPFTDIAADRLYDPVDLSKYIMNSARALHDIISPGGKLVQLDVTGRVNINEAELIESGFSNVKYVPVSSSIPVSCKYAQGEFVNVVVLRK